MAQTQFHEVTLVWGDDRTETLSVAEDETVMAAARRRDLIIPAGCLDGTCGTCAGLILEVSDREATEGPEECFEYRRPPAALREVHRKGGWVLLCIARPRVDCRLAVGAATRSKAHEAPWQ